MIEEEISLHILRYLIPSMTFLLIFQGASAIDMYFSARDGSRTVGVVESYDVDERIGVSSSASASFDGEFRIAEKNCLWVSGNSSPDTGINNPWRVLPRMPQRLSPQIPIYFK